MINFDIPELSINYILSRVSEEQIYEYYLNAKVKKDTLVKCCFHNDRSPSLGFYKSRGDNLMFKCFGCGEQGGVFSFVMKKFTCSFKESLEKVNKDFNLSNSQTIQNRVSTSIEVEETHPQKKTQIIPTFRSFSKVDYNYWYDNYYITLDLLLDYDIRACKLVYIVTKSGTYKLWAEHANNNPIYSYRINENYKIYRPLSPKGSKWVSNTTSFDIQGLRQLPKKGELLIITSSMKDVLVLKLLGYDAIALGGEGNVIPERVLDYLYACYDNIIIFYDNDEAGLQYGKKTADSIGCSNIYIPTEYEDTKDISDYMQKYRWEEAERLMKKLI